MNWDAIGTIAEVVAALAVIMSLIYVGSQIKQNTKSSRAKVINQVNSQYGQLMCLLATDGELANIYRTATEGGELAPDQTIRYGAYLGAFFAYAEEADLLTSGRIYEELETFNFVEFMAPTIKRMLDNPVGRNWWENESANIYIPEFCKKVERVCGFNPGQSE